MIASFIAGFVFCIFAIAGLSALCLRIAAAMDKSKPKEPPKGISAVSMDMNNNNGGIASLDAWHQRMVREILERIEGRA